MIHSGTRSANGGRPTATFGSSCNNCQLWRPLRADLAGTLAFHLERTPALLHVLSENMMVH